MGARTIEMKPQGRARQTSCTNVHKANQLSFFYMGSFARVHSCPNDLLEQVVTDTLK